MGQCEFHEFYVNVLTPHNACRKWYCFKTITYNRSGYEALRFGPRIVTHWRRRKPTDWYNIKKTVFVWRSGKKLRLHFALMPPNIIIITSSVLFFDYSEKWLFLWKRFWSLFISRPRLNILLVSPLAKDDNYGKRKYYFSYSYLTQGHVKREGKRGSCPRALNIRSKLKATCEEVIKWV